MENEKNQTNHEEIQESSIPTKPQVTTESLIAELSDKPEPALTEQNKQVEVSKDEMNDEYIDYALPTIYSKNRIDDGSENQKLVDCPRCKETNDNDVICKQCGWIFNIEATHQIMNELAREPESLKVIARAIVKLSLVEKLISI